MLPGALSWAIGRAPALGGQSPAAALSEQEEIPPVWREDRTCQLGGCWGGEEEPIEEDPSSKVTFIEPGGRMEQAVEEALVGSWRPGGHGLAQDPSAMAPKTCCHT